MAIPPNLNRISLSGVYRDPTATNPGDIWEWAQVFHVDADILVGGAPDVGKLKEVVNWKFSLYQSGGLFSPMGRGVFCTERKGVNVATDFTWQFADNTELNPIAGSGPLPVGVAAFLFGRSNVLGRQTRKWVPGIRADLWLASQQYWDTGETGLGNAFFLWCTTLLAPTNLPMTGPIKDVVWDAANEVARDITEVWLEKYPRTKGSRQLAGKENALRVT